MVISKNRQAFFLFLLGIIFCSAILIGIIFRVFFNDSSLVNVPLHSTIAGVGAAATILMAVFLLYLQHDDEKNGGEYSLLSMGFLMMGILDTFHSITVVQHGFILLRSLANVFSGFWFALLWIPGAGRYISKIRSLPLIIALISIVIGIVTICYREFLPFMLKNGEFTPFAIFINLIAGFFAIGAGLYFLFEFLRYKTTESYLFTGMFLMLGLSGIEFPLSDLWGYLWWFWHAERCLAYAVVLIYMIRIFLWNRNELRKINGHLEERIAERTKELSYEVAERTRYGNERDKVIAELQEANTRIKILTGLLPTCACCKKIRNSSGDWEQMESYIQKHSEATFSHGICLECAKKLYPDLYDDRVKGLALQDKGKKNKSGNLIDNMPISTIKTI